MLAGGRVVRQRANFVSMLSQVLWYLDPHHEKFASRGIHLPDRFSAYRGYNDFKKKKEKEPRLLADGLQHHLDQLSGVLMQPWMSGKRFEVIRGDVEKLVDALHKYREYLVSQCEKVQYHQQLLEPPSVDENASLVTLPAKKGSPTSSSYRELELKLSSLSLYQPLFLNDIAPAD